MGTRKDGEWRDHASDNGMQPAYHTQAQIKIERTAEDTRRNIVQDIPRSGKGIQTVSKACGHILRKDFCRSCQTESLQMVQRSRGLRK